MKQSKNRVEKQTRFAIKKLSIGAAAVLVSTGMYLGVKSGNVSADANNAPAAVVSTQTNAKDADQSATAEPATGKSSADSDTQAQEKQTPKVNGDVPAETKQTQTQTVTRTIETQIEGQDSEVETKQTADISRDRYWIQVGYNKDDTSNYRVIRGGGTIYGTDGPASSSSSSQPYARLTIINYAYPEGDPNRVTHTSWVKLDNNGDPLPTDGKGNPIPTSGWGDWSAWTTASFDAVPAPDKPGYTVTNPDAAPAVTDVTGDSTVTFIYTANAHTQVINYVDEDNNKNVIDTYNVDGKTGETKDTNIDSNVPDGYVIDGSYPETITFGANDPEPINVLVVKKQGKPIDAVTQPEAPVEAVVVYQDSQTGEVVNTTEQEYKDGEKIGFDVPAGYEPTDKLPDLTATPDTGVIVIPVTKVASSTGTPTQTPDEPTNNAPHDQTPTNTPDDQPEKDTNTPVKAQPTPKKNHDSKSRVAARQHSNGNVKSRTMATQKQTVTASNTTADSKATLPQTGSKNNDMAAIGLGMAAMAGILSLLGFKKKEN